MCYLPSGHIIFSLRKLKFYGGRGPGADDWGADKRAGGEMCLPSSNRKEGLIFYFENKEVFNSKMFTTAAIASTSNRQNIISSKHFKIYIFL